MQIRSWLLDDGIDHSWEGFLHQRQGRHREAIRELKLAVSKYPDDHLAHDNLGIEFSRIGKHGAALQHFQRAVTLNPDSAQYNYNMGITLCELGREGESIAYLDEALRLDPSDSKALQALSAAHRRCGDNERGLECLLQAIGQWPNDEWVQFNLAEVALELRRYDLTEVYGKKVVEAGGSLSSEANALLGICAYLRDDLAGAFHKMDLYLRGCPDDPVVATYYGRVLNDRGRLWEAEEFLRESVEKWPGDPEFEVQLGCVLVNQEKFNEGIKWLKSAIRKKMMDPQAHKFLGMAFDGLGEKQKAVKQYRKAMSMDPEDSELQQECEELLASE